MKDKRNGNSGYTLIELIIVIAIIAIMSGVGILTVGSIRTSQATASMQRFDEELSALVSKTRSYDGSYAIKIVRNGANYDIYYGYYTGDDSEAADPTKFTRLDTSSTKADAVLERVTIYYSPDYSSANEKVLGADDDGDAGKETVIRVRKSDNRVIYGSGQYRFVKYNSSNDTVGRINFSKETGSHTYVKSKTGGATSEEK